MPGVFDWLSRKTESIHVGALSELRGRAIKKQNEIYQLMRPGLSPELPADLLSLTRDEIEPLYKELEKRGADYQAIAALLKDHESVVAITDRVIEIPQKDGPSVLYAELQLSAGGVTEKVSLSRFSSMSPKLTNLLTSDSGELARDYLALRGAVKVGLNAIIKLPKKGDITEVQNEVLALSISAGQHLITTSNTMISHDGLPGVFVPFADITELKEIARGEERTAISLTFKKYQENGTISPVGEGLQGDSFVQGIGDAFALILLCKDPDAIGGYLQNKAVTNSRGGDKLFVFDQVVKASNYLKTDRSLNIKADGWFNSNSRHFSGRNSSIINDADFEDKYHSLVKMIARSGDILHELEQAITLYSEQMGALLPGSQEYKILDTLKDKAVKMLPILNTRIREMETLLDSYPQIGDRETAETRKVALLERLLNKPTLYNSLGRPYQHIHSDTTKAAITRVEVLDGDRYRLSLKGLRQSELEVAVRRINAVTGLALTATMPMIISKDQLLVLNEFSISPESQPQVSETYDYLNPRDLQELKKHYASHEMGGEACNFLANHAERLRGDDAAGFVRHAKTVQTVLNRTLASGGENLGFIAHVKRLSQYATQQKVLSLIDGDVLKEKTQQAFTAAKTLDRVDGFQEVLLEATLHGSLSTGELERYLDEVIALEMPTTHQGACVVSEEFRQMSEDAVLRMQRPVKVKGTSGAGLAALIDGHVSISHEVGTLDIADDTETDPLAQMEVAREELREAVVSSDVRLEQEAPASDAGLRPGIGVGGDE